MHRMRHHGPGMDSPTTAEAFPGEMWGQTIAAYGDRCPAPVSAVRAPLHAQFLAVTRFPKGFGIELRHWIGEMLLHGLISPQDHSGGRYCIARRHKDELRMRHLAVG